MMPLGFEDEREIERYQSNDSLLSFKPKQVTSSQLNCSDFLNYTFGIEENYRNLNNQEESQQEKPFSLDWNLFERTPNVPRAINNDFINNSNSSNKLNESYKYNKISNFSQFENDSFAYPKPHTITPLVHNNINFNSPKLESNQNQLNHTPNENQTFEMTLRNQQSINYLVLNDFDRDSARDKDQPYYSSHSQKTPNEQQITPLKPVSPPPIGFVQITQNTDLDQTESETTTASLKPKSVPQNYREFLQEREKFQDSSNVQKPKVEFLDQDTPENQFVEEEDDQNDDENEDSSDSEWSKIKTKDQGHIEQNGKMDEEEQKVSENMTHGKQKRQKDLNNVHRQSKHQNVFKNFGGALQKFAFNFKYQNFSVSMLSQQFFKDIESSTDNFKKWVETEIPLSKKQDFINGWTIHENDQNEIKDYKKVLRCISLIFFQDHAKDYVLTSPKIKKIDIHLKSINAFIAALENPDQLIQFKPF